MKIILFGATGMVGQGVLLECLRDPAIVHITSVGRTETGLHDPRLTEIVLPDLFAIERLRNELTGFDACFFCLGVSVVGLAADRYERVTYDLTLAIARLLAEVNPALAFVYVSGAGTDPTGQSRYRWARVKGRTERDLASLRLRAVYLFRPSFIQPVGGIVSKTWLYRLIYAAIAPFEGLILRAFPTAATTTERIGRAMIAVIRQGYPQPVLETVDINRAAAAGGAT